MTQTERSIKELERAGLFNKDSDYEGMLGEAVKELLEVFGKQGHSGSSAAMTSEIFHKLVNEEPISPLTSDPSEWNEVSDGLFQSNRVSHVFIDKNKSERPYTINGRAFSDNGGRSYFTSINSRVYFDLPGFPPKTEYMILENDMSDLRIVEINGVKIEVDLRTAKRVDQFKVGDAVKVLRKKYSDSYESHFGMIVGFDEFKNLPTIIVAYLDSTSYQSAINFVYLNEKCADVEICPHDPNDIGIEKSDIITKFVREIEKKEAEIQDLKTKQKYFETMFGRYFT